MSEIENPLPECPSSPNCVRKAITFKADSSQLFLMAEKILSDMSAETIESKSASLRIDAVFRIPIFGYRDDVAIVIQPRGVNSTLFIRSASRLGYWDIFVNSIRVKRIIKHIKKQLSN